MIFHLWPTSVINGINYTEGPYNEKKRALNNHNAKGNDKGKVTPISKDIFLFWFLTATFVFQIQCFCIYHLFVFFHCSKQNAFEKTSQTKWKKEDITLQNLVSNKNIYSPPNFICVHKKDVKCTTMPSKWVIMLNKSNSFWNSKI